MEVSLAELESMAIYDGLDSLVAGESCSPAIWIRFEAEVSFARAVDMYSCARMAPRLEMLDSERLDDTWRIGGSHSLFRIQLLEYPSSLSSR
eukprot:2627782-Pleurochrysis_carterae.AAC.2